MKRTISLTAIVLFTLTATQAATVILDSKDHASVVTAGSQATFGAQSFQLNVAGAGTNDTVTANSPLTSSATIQTITFVKAPLGTATTGSLFIKLYDTGANASGTPLAVSTNSIDVNGAASLVDLAWTFASPTVSTTTTYYAVFSTNGLSDSTGTDGVGARIAAANFGGGFNNTVYAADINLRGWNSANPPVGQTLDARFRVDFTTIPETSVSLLGACSMLLLMRRNRR